MSEPSSEPRSEVKQASKEAKESENVAEKYSSMSVSKNSEMSVGELSSSSFSAVSAHKPGKKVSPCTPAAAHTLPRLLSGEPSHVWAFICARKHTFPHARRNDFLLRTK